MPTARRPGKSTGNSSGNPFARKPDLSFAKDIGKNLAEFNFGRLAEDIMGLFMNGSKAGTGSSRIKGELEKMLGRFEMVTRREFEAVRDIAIAARSHAEELAEHLGHKSRPAARKPAAKKTPAKKAPVKKPAAKKSAAKKPAAKKAPAKKTTRQR